MMKNIILTVVVFLFTLSYSYSQEFTTFKVAKEKPLDTLKLLQGTWNFQYMNVVKDGVYKEYIHTTNMIISDSTFCMWFSEASFSGEIVTIGHKIVFMFDYGEWVDMEIASFDKSNVSFIMKNMDISYFTDKAQGQGDLIFTYKKPKRIDLMKLLYPFLYLPYYIGL